MKAIYSNLNCIFDSNLKSQWNFSTKGKKIKIIFDEMASTWFNNKFKNRNYIIYKTLTLGTRKWFVKLINLK